MPPSIMDIEAEIVEEFSFFDNWMDKYQFIIDMGKDLAPIPDEAKTDEHIVRGCQSQVWLTAHFDGERVYYQADSDAIITKGLISMLIRVLSGHLPAEILESELSFVDKIGIRQHLSPTRSNGLNAMIKQMKLYALGFQAQKQIKHD